MSRNQLSGESVLGFCVFVLACSYVVRNNRYFTERSIKRSFFNRSEVVKQSCIMVCLAVRFAFEFQGRKFVHENRKALVPDVILFIVVVEMMP